MINNQNTINQSQEPSPNQALETIISAVRLLQLNYESHVRLDLCISVLRAELDGKTPQVEISKS